MDMQNVKNQVKQVFTPSRLRKAAVLAVLTGVISAGGAYWEHQNAQARSLMEKQARAEMIAAQAEQRGVVLIDEAHVRAIAAEAIGKDASELNFHKIHLTIKEHCDHDNKYERKHKHDRWEERAEHQNHDRMAASPLAESASTSTAPTQSDFRPFYKVKCYAGNVEYKLRIDAVTGAVLSSKVDVDDNIF